MSSTRKQRMTRLLKEELSHIILKEMNDPRLGFVSIIDIEFRQDYRAAKIFISVYGTPEQQAESMEVLKNASSFLRGELSRQIDLRYTPELIFVHDTSIERGSHIFELLKQAKEMENKDVPAPDVEAEDDAS
ncbi:MAG: 30S ribosome-binding factor RbfA [bacterium]